MSKTQCEVVQLGGFVWLSGVLMYLAIIGYLRSLYDRIDRLQRELGANKQ